MEERPRPCARTGRRAWGHEGGQWSSRSRATTVSHRPAFAIALQWPLRGTCSPQRLTVGSPMGWITGPGGFPGLVAGVIVQACANALMLGWQRNNAKEVLRCGLEMNLHEVRLLKDRIESLKQRISANQADPPDLWITMPDFDHSALNPLVTSGHFHKMPGSDGVRRYLSGSRFFNNPRRPAQPDASGRTRATGFPPVHGVAGGKGRRRGRELRGRHGVAVGHDSRC